MGAKVRGATTQRGPTEKVFMGQVIDYLRLMGWSVYHTFLSIRSEPGFPDIVAARAGRLAVIETKSLAGQLTPAQERWLGILGGVPCVETFVLRPTEEDWQLIERTFR